MTTILVAASLCPALALFLLGVLVLYSIAYLLYLALQLAVFQRLQSHVDLVEAQIC